MADETDSQYMNQTIEDDSWKSSYVLDPYKTYGKRLFFKYYSETNEDNFSLALVRIVALIIICLMSLLYNLFTIVCLIRLPNMKSVTNCFTANIGFSNLVLSLTTPIVVGAWYWQTWIWGDFICKITFYLQTSSIIVSHWIITLLAVDRYRCIVVPPYNSFFTPSWTVISCLLIWLLVLLVFLPLTFWFEEVKYKDFHNVCALILPPTHDFSPTTYFFLALMLFFWICPLPLCFYLLLKPYLKMIATSSIWASSATMVEHNGPTRPARRQSEVSMSEVMSPWTRRFSSLTGYSSGRQNSLSQQEETRKNKRLRAARILLSNAALSAPLWLLTSPIFVLLCFDVTRKRSEATSVLEFNTFNISLTVTFFFSLVNMMYYGFCSDNFKKKFKKILCWRKPSKEVNEIMTPVGCKTNNNILPALKQESIEISEK